MREEKAQKMHFDSIKWELYRQRVEQIEDDYAEFKRRQKKIQWWLNFVKRHQVIKKARHNFEQNHALVQEKIRKHYA